MSTTALDLIIAGLTAMGADGLCTDGCGCGCDDLIPCDASPAACVPALRVIATEAGEYHEPGDMVYVPMDQPNDQDQRGA